MTPERTTCIRSPISSLSSFRSKRNKPWLSQAEATGAVPSRRRPDLSARAVRADRHSTQNDFGVQRFAPLTLDQLLSLQLVAPKDSNVPEQQRGRPVCLLIVTGRQATRGEPRVARHEWLAAHATKPTVVRCTLPATLRLWGCIVGCLGNVADKLHTLQICRLCSVAPLPDGRACAQRCACGVLYCWLFATWQASHAWQATRGLLRTLR